MFLVFTASCQIKKTLCKSALSVIPSPLQQFGAFYDSAPTTSPMEPFRFCNQQMLTIFLSVIVVGKNDAGAASNFFYNLNLPAALCVCRLINQFLFGDLDPGDLYTLEVSAASEGTNPVYRNYTLFDSTFPLPPVIAPVGEVTKNNTLYISWTPPQGFHQV